MDDDAVFGFTGMVAPEGSLMGAPCPDGGGVPCVASGSSGVCAATGAAGPANATANMKAAVGHTAGTFPLESLSSDCIIMSLRSDSSVQA
ncbi:hypothetical protein ACU4GH_18225 [Bradyrhizobium betae]